MHRPGRIWLRLMAFGHDIGIVVYSIQVCDTTDEVIENLVHARQ